VNSAESTLFATPASVQAIERARALVILVGGYDGSGNYGDIAQFDAAMELVARLGPGVLVLPVLERQYLAEHRKLKGGGGEAERPTLFFDPGGEGEHVDDLLPVAAPVDLAFGASYLYGGGYLNRLWGPRKLALLAAAEALLLAGGAAPSCRLSSGLQVEPEWVAELAASGSSALGRLDLLGARDGNSHRALAALGGSAPAVETGDDAIGLLGRLPAADAADGDGRFRLNLHFAEHEWVTERPQAVLDFYTGFLAELGRLAERPLTVQPLIAYLDSRIDERLAMERFISACTAIGVEVAEPLVLRPAGLGAAAPLLSQARLTLSCSYHVALTSLMLEVPAVLIGDNDYYEQKAAGLRKDFGLPATFTVATSADPAASAAAVAPALLDDELHKSLAAGVRRLRQRRAASEVELLGRLGGAAASALADRLEERTERLRRHAAEPAALQERLGALQSETEELRRLVEESPLEAELRVQEAEARAEAAEATLAAALGSRSWRMAAPLRRVGSLMRRG